MKITIRNCFVFLFTLTIIYSGLFAQGGPLNGSGGGIIAFVSDRDGSTEIYLMNADGTDQTRVTNNNAFEFDLSWSRDGQRLAFISSLHSGFELYVMDVVDISNAAFSSPVQLTNNAVMDMSPSWSPDGSKIVFFSNGTGIMIINADGSYDTTVSTSPVTGSQPSWSPIGNTISFSGQSGSNTNIYTINTNSTNLQQITFHNYDLVPEWSPDGNKISYVSTNNGAEDVFIINADGTGDRSITTSLDNDFVPSWSPEGDRIVYEGSTISIDQICIIDTNGNNYQQLTTLGSNIGPSWRSAPGVNDLNSDDKSYQNPDVFQLYQNYPNPFNAETNIVFDLNQNTVVTVQIFDVTGSLLRLLIDNVYFAKGHYSIKFSAEYLPSGIYYYRLLTESGQAIVKKMCLMK